MRACRHGAAGRGSVDWIVDGGGDGWGAAGSLALGASTGAGAFYACPGADKKVIALACVPMILNKTSPQGMLRLDKK